MLRRRSGARTNEEETNRETKCDTRTTTSLKTHNFLWGRVERYVELSREFIYK